MKTNKGIIKHVFLISIILTGCISWRTPEDNRKKYLDEHRFKSYETKQISNRKLTWEDFKGETKKYSKTQAAEVIWYIFYYPDSSRYIGKTFDPDVKVWCAFDERSWVIPNFKSDYLLNHEQGHFDIVKLYADSMQKLIPTLQPFSESNWRSKIDSLKSNIMTRCKNMQRSYDKETNYAQNSETQFLWDSILNYKLSSLK